MSAITALVLVAVLVTGCVERKMIIRSDPPGATVFLNYDAALLSTTPAETSFRDYGTYAVRLVSKDHEELEAMAEVDAPWWSYPPFDLITELLVPFTVTDLHEFDYKLVPLSETLAPDTLREKNAELIRRAEEFRSGAKEELEEEAR